MLATHQVDGTASHAKFMAAMAERGIYVVVPLTRTYWGYLPADRADPACYEGDEGTNLVNSAKSIVRQFSKYTNTLFFTAANEIALNSGDAGYTSLPCVKALVRDMHKFQASCSAMRSVPLIYAGQDIGSQGRRLVSDYLSCADEHNGGSQAAIDVYGLNVYNWCSETEVYQNSGYKGIMDDYSEYGIPMIFSEFGCTGGDFATSCTSDDDPFPGGRGFVQVATLVSGANMDSTFSGGIAYEFSMESNGFGLVLKPGYLDGQDSHITLDSYKSLQGQFQTVAATDFGAANWTRHGDSRNAETLGDFCDWRPHATRSLDRPACPDYATLGITGELPPEPRTRTTTRARRTSSRAAWRRTTTALAVEPRRPAPPCPAPRTTTMMPRQKQSRPGSPAAASRSLAGRASAWSWRRRGPLSPRASGKSARTRSTQAARTRRGSLPTAPSRTMASPRWLRECPACGPGCVCVGWGGGVYSKWLAIARTPAQPTSGANS